VSTVTTTATRTTVPVEDAKSQEPEWIVWVVVALAVILGIILQYVVTGQTRSATVEDSNMSITYPATWVQTQEEGAQFAAADLRAGGPFGNRVVLRQIDKVELVSPNVTGAQPEPNDDLQTAGANWVIQRQNDLSGYRVLSVEPVEGGVQGKPAIHVEYAYLMDPTLGAGGMPGLMHAVDTIVLSSDKFYVMTFASESNRFQDTDDLQANLLSGWRVP
jgi:hypothetical protein